MGGFEQLYKDGNLAIVHGCGYEKPILSHFSSMGFWHTGIPHTGEKLGWLGRLAEALDPEVQRDYGGSTSSVACRPQPQTLAFSVL